MEKEKIIDGLKDLIKDRENLIDVDEMDSIFLYDKKVLLEAIKLIEKIQ